MADACSFSHFTVTRVVPRRAWRKKVRAPGTPTAPTVNASTSSNS